MERTKKAKAVLFLVTCLTLLAFAFRLHQLGFRSLWYDELLQLDIAQGPFSEIGPQLPRHAAMPLDYYLLHVWIKLGRQEGWVRFLAACFGTLAIPLTYTLGRRLFNRQTGCLAAALLTWGSFAVSYSQEARPYALLLCFTLVTFLGLWQVYSQRRFVYWGLALLGLAGAALTHYFSLFLLLPLGLFVAAYQLYHLKEARYWSYTMAFWGCLVVLGLIFILNQRVGVLYSVGNRFTRESVQLEAYTRPSTEKPNRGSGPPLEISFFREQVFMPLTGAEPVALLGYNLFFLLAVLSLLFKPHKGILLLLAWLILPTLLIYAFLLHRGTFFAIRYILYTLPAYLLLVAYGLERFSAWLTQLWRKSPGFEVAYTGLLSLALLPLLLTQSYQLLEYYATGSREDWRAVGQLLQANARPDDAVIAVRAEPTMNWYYPPAAASFGVYSQSQPIWEILNRQPRRWFILSSYSLRRDQGLREWLQRQQAVTIAIDRRVVVYFHEEGQSAAQLLAQVKTFKLPQKPLTYQILADQFKAQGDMETSQQFFERAEQLSERGQAPGASEPLWKLAWLLENR